MTGCYAKGCRNASAKGCKMSFFPKDPTRRAQWIDNCRKNCAITYTLPNRHAALCEFHFAADMWEKIRVDGTKKLKCTAVPTIFGDKVKQLEAVKEVDPNKSLKRKANASNIPTSALNNTGSIQKIFLCTNPNTNDLQIFTQPMPGQQYMKIVPVNVLGSAAKKPRIPPKIAPRILKGSQEVASIQQQTVPKQFLLVNNNAEPFTVEASKLQNGTPQVQEHEISESHLKEEEEKEEEEEEDSDSDSFIANNFEPVSDDEEVLSNFEPVSDNEMIISDPDASDSDIQDTKAQAKIDAMTAEEDQLNVLQEKYQSVCEKVMPCSRCEKLEKVYEKCNSIRIGMKKRHKSKLNGMKAKIKLLETKLMLLQSSQHGLNKIFNEDQIDFLSRDQKKVWKWSAPTIEKARLYKRTLGIKGYSLLLQHNWPLPSLRTLRNRGTKIMEQLRLEAREFMALEYDEND